MHSCLSSSSAGCCTVSRQSCTCCRCLLATCWCCVSCPTTPGSSSGWSWVLFSVISSLSLCWVRSEGKDSSCTEIKKEGGIFFSFLSQQDGMLWILNGKPLDLLNSAWRVVALGTDLVKFWDSGLMKRGIFYDFYLKIDFCNTKCYIKLIWMWKLKFSTLYFYRLPSFSLRWTFVSYHRNHMYNLVIYDLWFSVLKRHF